MPVSQLAILAEWVWLAPFWAWCLGAPLPSCPHSTHDHWVLPSPYAPLPPAKGTLIQVELGMKRRGALIPMQWAQAPPGGGSLRLLWAFFLPWLSTPGPQGPTLLSPSSSDCRDPQTHAQELLVFLAPRPSPQTQKLWLVIL